MRFALGLDFETEITDPVDPRVMRATEIGAVLWDIDAKKPVHMHNQLIQWGEYGTDDKYFSRPFDPRVTELTGITHEELTMFGVMPNFAYLDLAKLIARDDVLAVVAHNGREFDKIIYNCEVKRSRVDHYDVVKKSLLKPWIDTQYDIPYPDTIGTRKLQYLCAAHNFLNPYSHRALFDVLSMMRIFSNYDFDEILKRTQEKLFKVRALTRKPWTDDGISNALAKERGFKFDGNSKFWVKNVRESSLALELTKTPLEVVLLGEIDNGTAN